MFHFLIDYKLMLVSELKTLVEYQFVTGGLTFPPSFSEQGSYIQILLPQRRIKFFFITNIHSVKELNMTADVS